MGFPANYAEVTLPKPSLYALSLLCSIGNLISALFNRLGLSDFIESDMVWPENSTRTTSETTTVPALLFPVIKFEELVADRSQNCAVCLNEFKRGEEIRGLKICRHVFHRACLDGWIDHDQKTCPLCRTLF